MKIYFVGLLFTHALIVTHCGYFKDNIEEFVELTDDIDNDYDFIVAGGGVSGSIVARRLTENSNWRVLMLEVQNDPTKLQTVFKIKDSNNWQNDLEKPFEGRYKKVTYPRKKMLQGYKTDWNWDNTIKYFGYQKDSGRKSSQNWRQILTNAYDELGIKYIVDYNASRFIGVSEGARTSVDSERDDLDDVRERSNLHIKYNAEVINLDIDEDGNVKGLNYIYNNQKHKVRATKEYILAAGPYGTPKILLLSGLGPKKDLNDQGIKTSCDLNVGHNLQDHSVIPYFIKVPCVKTNDNERGTSTTAKSYFLDLVALTTTRSGGRRPDIMTTCRVVECHDQKTMKVLLEDLSNELVDSVVDVLHRDSVLVIGLYNIDPKSRGQVKLGSSNPRDPIIIRNKMFSDPEDIRTFIRAIRQQQQLLNTEAYKTHGFREVTPYLEVCDDKAPNSDDFWECYIKNVASPLEQAVGSVKMGSKHDRSAVVDECFQVFTTTNLRVADSSVIANIPPGPTLGATIKLAEVAAGFIIEDWSDKK